MAPSKLRQAIGAVKDRTSISLAKVGSTTSLSDLDVAIVKATRHEEHPAEEKHIREILSLTSYSQNFISACVNTLSRRLNKTKNWTVALKTLMLIQRLLSEGDPAYEQEIFFATRRGTRLLNMSDFRDTSHSNSWDYSAFVRTYALYLDERLELKMQGRRGKRSVFALDEEDDENVSASPSVKTTPLRDMKIDQIFSKAQHLQHLLERFLACRPTGVAKNNRVVIVALYPIVKESFQIYYDITDIMSVLIDRFMELDVPECVKVYDIFCRVTKQFNELDMFYGWCKTIGIARSSEYPDVEKIQQKKLEVMDEFIREKAASSQSRRAKIQEEKNIEPAQEVVKEPEEAVEPQEDMNAMKALPPPEGFCEQQKEETKPEDKPKEINSGKPQEADLLNLGEGQVTSEEHANQMALALFDGAATTTSSVPTLTWEAFTSDDNTDWETALVQSAGGLSNQKTSLAGGFDMLMLDGMYQQASLGTATTGAAGSASSVALGSAGKPAPMLALPAPPTANGGPTTTGQDPFAASVSMPPPAYVQMSEMEKKQKLLVEEQQMWQQYARDGMQGQLGVTNLQPNPYNIGGYTHSY